MSKRNSYLTLLFAAILRIARVFLAGWRFVKSLLLSLKPSIWLINSIATVVPALQMALATGEFLALWLAMQDFAWTTVWLYAPKALYYLQKGDHAIHDAHTGYCAWHDTSEAWSCLKQAFRKAAVTIKRFFKFWK